MNKYSPNFNDPRVIARITTAVKWARKYLSITKSSWLSTREIDKHLGSQRNDLSKYLRGKLLICTKDKYSFSKSIKSCKEYCLNQEGVNFLMTKTNLQLQYCVVEVSDKLAEQLTTGDFEYKDSSNRLFNPIQNIKREAKKQLLSNHGYRYEYDIQCSAFTLILQYAQHCGMDEYPFAIYEYIRNRDAIRNRISTECEITPDIVKRIINGLLQGAIISHEPTSSIIKELQGDHSKIEWFKQDEFIQELKRDIKLCWDYIRPYVQMRTITTKRGITKKLPITSKQKTGLYRELERQVLDSVRTYLDKISVRYFLEHDGWTCESDINQTELIEFVRTTTGFVIELESTIHD